MISLIGYYIWKLKNIIQKGPEDPDQNQSKLRTIIKY